MMKGGDASDIAWIPSLRANFTSLLRRHRGYFSETFRDRVCDCDCLEGTLIGPVMTSFKCAWDMRAQTINTDSGNSMRGIFFGLPSFVIGAVEWKRLEFWATRIQLLY
jgi:hypothetical protein